MDSGFSLEGLDVGAIEQTVDEITAVQEEEANRATNQQQIQEQLDAENQQAAA